MLFQNVEGGDIPKSQGIVKEQIVEQLGLVGKPVTE